jgi:hypothetical protein
MAKKTVGCYAGFTIIGMAIVGACMVGSYFVARQEAKSNAAHDKQSAPAVTSTEATGPQSNPPAPSSSDVTGEGPAARVRKQQTREKEARLAAAPSSVTIAGPESCQLCADPDCEDDPILRIPPGIELTVEDTRAVKLPKWSVIWFQVTYKGKTGWISEFVTDAAPAEPRYY